MEGCYHLFTPVDTTPWPGQLLSTGMEDYYDSAFYFDGGPFHAPVAGSTHMSNQREWSGYRIHEMDPLVFSNGVSMRWRSRRASNARAKPRGGASSCMRR